jgi:hypothetical protein
MTYDGTHQSIPFSGLHKAKLQTGLRTALVINGGLLAPEGAGDVYLATDALEVYVCRDGEALEWELYNAGGGGGGLTFSGTKREMNADATLTSGVAFDLGWGSTAYDTDDDYTGDAQNFKQPAAGVYQYSLYLRFQNTAPGDWHIEIRYNNSTTSLPLDHRCDGSGEPDYIAVTGQFYTTVTVPNANAFASIHLYHYSDGDVDQDILTYSFFTIQRISEALC